MSTDVSGERIAPICSIEEYTVGGVLVIHTSLALDIAKISDPMNHHSSTSLNTFTPDASTYPSCGRSGRTSCVGRRVAHRSHDRSAMSAGLARRQSIGIVALARGLFHGYRCNFELILQIIRIIRVNKVL